MSFTHCLEKQTRLKELFYSCKTQEEKYLKIIELGRSLPLMSENERLEMYRISGCQSLLYLKTNTKEGRLFFSIYSNAMISLGLAALLIEIYQEEFPETLLKCPPKILQELDIATSVSPGRINGLNSLYTRMKRDALTLLYSS